MKNHIFYKSSAQIASLRWQHRPILGPPCRSRRRRFHGDLNLSRRFIRPHSPGIDFGSDGPTFNPLLLHPPFLSFFFLSRLLLASSPTRDSPTCGYSLLPAYSGCCLLSSRDTRDAGILANIEQADWPSLRTSRKRYCQTHQVHSRAKGLSSSKGQETICDRNFGGGTW